MGAKRKSTGRPSIVWDEKDIATFKSMCSVFCTEEEICAVLGVTDKTLVKLINRYLYEDVTGHKLRGKAERITFTDAFNKYSAQGRSSIRRTQFKQAQAGNTTMLIWLGKQYLGQTDVIETTVTEVPMVIDDFE